MTSTNTKIHPVFDASCRSYNNLSLNDLLNIGPKLQPLIVGILVRFRRWPIGLTADIKQAFLQIALNPSHKDFCRFLLWINGKIRIMRFNRLPFGISCAPFLLNAVIKFHLESYPTSEVIQELHSNIYVDDWLSGADSLQEAASLYSNANEILNMAGLPLTK